MKKRLFVIIIAIMCIAGGSILYGAGELLQEEGKSRSVTEEESQEQAMFAEDSSDEHGQNASAEEKNSHDGDDAVFTDTKEEPDKETDSTQASMGMAYAYENLGEQEQQVYLEILEILQNLQSDVTISLLDEERLADIFQCVMNDHPEIFYVEGYTFTKFTRGEQVVRIEFSGTYTMEAEEIAVKKRQIENYVNRCMAGLTARATEYDKVKYVYEYLINHTEYNLQAEENQNICSVFIGGESVCQGYAKATQYLLNMLGIPSTLVIGQVDNGEGHAWNLVQIDGNYYYVDTTWGDASYRTMESGQENPLNPPPINYDYLCVTTEQLSATHVIDNVVPMPDCVATQANYYVKEGAYFTEYDEEKLENLFQTKQEAGDIYITLKCDSYDVYQMMKQKLVEEEKIFDYMHVSQGSVAYVNNGKQLSLSFWISEE